MIRVTIGKAALRAIFKFVSKEDIRHYLNGVLVELGTEEMRLVATNGSMLGVMRLRYADGDLRPNTTYEVIIPAELLKGIKKASRRDLVAVMVEMDGEQVTLIDGDTRTSAKPIDGKFPAWRRIMPKTLSGKTCQFNAAYLWAFVEAQHELHSNWDHLVISYNGDEAALVSIGNQDFVGVLMPVRTDDSLSAAPSWINAPISAAIPTAKAA